MKLIDSRRLTGPSMHGREPLAIAEIALDGMPHVDAEAAWRREVLRMLAALGWESTTSVRHYPGGMDAMLTAPIDRLLAMTEVNEWAVASVGGEAAELNTRAAEIAALAKAQENPALLRLQREAQAHAAAFLWDDTQVSVGLGHKSRTFAIGEIPGALDWHTIGSVPVALVTGTNGKTTCSRLLARMVQAAGFVCGNSTSDAVTVNGEVVDRGDWTGPAAARLVLRDPRVTAAVLETARGGILRRGLAMARADVAIITNIAEDHTGGYGVFDLETMTRVKRVVGDAAAHVVLNADDAHLNKLTFAGDVSWFSLQPRLDGACVRDGQLCWNGRALLSTSDAPICFAGAARYNVANALACIAAGFALGLPEAAIVSGLRSFGLQRDDNPGRAERYSLGGVTVLLDFAHNSEGIAGVLALVKSWKPRRLFVITGGAGDRTDDELRSGARTIAAERPHQVLCRDLFGYLRGRAPGAVPRLLTEELHAHGVSNVVTEENEAACLRRAFGEASAGDAIVLLVHLEREAVQAVLASLEG